MEALKKLVLFHLDEQKFALDLNVVERGIRVVEITSVPKAPPFVSGVINMSGRIIPVLNTRALLGLPDKEIGLDDHLLIAWAAGFKVALLMDEVIGVIDFNPQKFTASGGIFPEIGKVEGTVRLEGDIVFIYDLKGFVFRDDLSALTKEMSRETSPAITATEPGMVEYV
ncbi:MAG: chemotaxis protein CheW [Deltaproteobacteria bacterium]|nr:chemotaxis protein CheW [Deltaproteobacteria bacterium]